jgi:Domain of unknown function (DUF1877)
MGMCLALHSVSDQNINKILEQPELIWRLIASDDPEIYEEAIKEKNKVGLLSKLFGKKDNKKIEIPNLDFIEGENVDDDLDKSWQGIHYCLNKTPFEAPPPMDFITVGGQSAGEVDVGYGPARLFSSKMVNDIHDRLSRISGKDIAANYDPLEMEKLDIYPNIWERDGDEGLVYITEYFNTLKSFVENCVKNNLGMAVYLC